MCVCVQIEELGSEGRVEEAQGMMKLVEQLKEEREELSANPSVSLSFLFLCLSAEHTLTSQALSRVCFGTDLISRLSDN